MENYRKMWMSLRNDLSMRIREYRQADNIAGLDDYALTELDAWEGIMQEIEGFERELEENNQNKRNKNDIQNMEKKAEAFDEIKEYTLDKIETLTTRQEFAPDSNDFEYFGNLLTAFKAVKYKMIDLERDSDEEV